ncbi:MAG: oxidoreductase [Candidatus Lambdaproteobacteria bacterium RIFOXYD1_FULL_56_27]|uniref:Oxidoreductase n=1 Tax=Candidatus Lambdaproteobacteria bacterium RIFOXYD2_FULL_56_26 TaxID=1817773 RepID=A0A1F6H389_9PROT|nr:MAG: oxidoreductase [Candidatus Lambdaproteobacteria bacterium RIFOXYD2_FULL_56_26]OGH05371.1 MAG: oxidoreductase [Candidatus Lambdaproteobacteria bacterium RIFOXYC1_FULL_56_13]OGH09215.1 MAG: oxidoreductase [Candidatus Lambdaproteobacteria bacterium RIFOXYD1_FULL_56_27]
MSPKPKYPGTRTTTNGNTLVALYTEARIAEAGIFYPITPSTEMGENFQLSFANGELNVFGQAKIALETEGEHAAQSGSIAASVTGKRVVNFTSGQGIPYGCEPYYHAPSKFSTMVLEVAARALTKSALNVHCGHDDVYTVLDTGWTMLFAKDAQQAADQAMILRKVNELTLNPGINIQDGFLTSHLERTFLIPEADLIREYLGRPDDQIECPTEAQKALFGPKRRRVPIGMDLKNPLLMGPVQNQEHYMNGVIARRNHFVEPILGFLEKAYEEFGVLTGRHYGLISQYNCEKAETVFVSLGSSAENIEAAVDYLKETRGETVGAIHLNVIRPFPEKAVINALRGKKNVIILERMDDQTASDNPMARDIRTALSKALTNSKTKAFAELPAITLDEMPRLFSGVYGLGSRDFRPEGVLGAYEFVTGKIARMDGKWAKDGVSFIYVGVDHPYGVISQEMPSLLPENAVAIRFHSIGGWGAITTGKNLSEVIGSISGFVAERDKRLDESGQPEEVFHISANPKYGSEKKGAPTNYFLVAAPKRIRVNCDLRHVDVVLCCDPKAFTHTNPLEGLKPKGAFIIETDETTSEGLWSRIPKKHRQWILDNQIRVYGLSGFKIAQAATDREDLQFRMQGNSFLGAFFKVSPILGQYNIPEDTFLQIVQAQYVKKFGRFGDAVVNSNMTVMTEGFKGVWLTTPGAVDASDRSSMRGELLLPLTGVGRFDHYNNIAQPAKAPYQTAAAYDAEFRAGLGYFQPSTVLASTGVMAAATAATSSKYVSRRRVPVFYPENCTQCMACIISCPDTAMPNTAQNLDTVLDAAVEHYVSDPAARKSLKAEIPKLDKSLRTAMMAQIKENKGQAASVAQLLEVELGSVSVSDQAKKELVGVIKNVPLAYAKARTIFEIPEKKEAGTGGVFSIYISDLCKGCGECVVECGDHQALKMVTEDEVVNGQNATSLRFMDLLPDTPQKYLGKYDAQKPLEARGAILQNHLMIRTNYDALVSGDGACAGCGEKSVLRSIATITEAVMRPLYHQKAERLESKAKALVSEGTAKIAELKTKDAEGFKWWSTAVRHLILGQGGENEKDSLARIERFGSSEADLIKTLDLVLRQESFNHRDLRAVDGRYANGMSVMMMSSSTGCNSVYGSTHPNNPHPYPWMNSLFQDSPTLAWAFGETMIMDHARRSVLPERLVDALLSGKGISHDDYWDFTHFTDALMSDQEVLELPKVWAIGGDGAMGDIGFQNLSKVVLQNRPNVKCLMLDTQVYSNTGGQNSDSSVMPGGFDMNQFGKATEGKLIERKEVTSILMSGHGSPFIAQVSMANSSSLYKAVLDAVAYRGTAYIQSFTTCQPEHGVPDNVSTQQAQLVRDSRGMPELVFNPGLGETYPEALVLKGNPNPKRDWYQKKDPEGKPYNFTVAHWATTEARFRKHFFTVKPGEEAGLVHLDVILGRVAQDDVVHRRFYEPSHPAFIPAKGVYILMEKKGKMVPMGISRQLVLFCIERRKNWRMLQSMAGVENEDYRAQRANRPKPAAEAE